MLISGILAGQIINTQYAAQIITLRYPPAKNACGQLSGLLVLTETKPSINLMQTRQLLAIVWEKSKLNLKSEAAVNYLSYIWWIIEPVIQMLCYYLVFELLLNRGGPGYVYFLLIGLVPWLWFTRTISHSSNSLLAGRVLMGQIFIPKLFFPLVSIIQCGVKQILVFTTLLIFLVASGFTLSIHWLSLPAIIMVQLIFMVPLACLLAVAVVYVRDLSFVIPTALQFMFFCSGIFFSFEQIAPEYTNLLFANPMAGLVHQYREVLIHGAWPDWLYLTKILSVSVILWLAALFVYKNYEYTITRVTQE